MMEMTFDEIIDEKLWAVRYDKNSDNELYRLLLDSTTDLEELFKPLDNRVTVARDIEEMKTKPTKRKHPSWLRIYAIRLADGKYIITGGAIKLTREMRDREHTQKELVKIDKVRDFLKDNDIFDDDSFVEYLEIN